MTQASLDIPHAAPSGAQVPTEKAKTRARVSLNSSRLVRFLSDLAVSDVPVSHGQLTRKLGQLIGFSNSITISGLHSDLSRMVFEPLDMEGDASQTEFLRVRQGLVELIVKSFLPPSEEGKTAKIRMPVIDRNTPVETAGAYEPYRRFYSAQQRELDFQVQNLQTYVRDAAAGISLGLTQLVALDKAMSDLLALQHKRSFAGIPFLLARRFDYLLQEHQKAQGVEVGSEAKEDDGPEMCLLKGEWFESFLREMQGLLLAELEARLLPVLGLIEAINEEVDKNHD